jgi:hypothetical protein
MNINMTLIVQSVNFCIVYLMVRHFLFKPVVTIIEREQSEEQALHDIIDQQKKSLEIQEKERQRSWVLCQEYCTIHQPQLVHQRQSFCDEIEYSSPTISSPSTQAIAHAATQLSSALEEKIKHVH